MKKVLIFLTLGGFMAFAADAPTFARGNVAMLHNQAGSPEETLALKLERIDGLVSKGRITAEKAAEFKAAITERMSNCDGTADRDSKERLGIGFGRTGDKGQFQGFGRSK